MVHFGQPNYSINEADVILNTRIVLTFKENATLERDIVVSVSINSSVEGVEDDFRLAENTG